MLGILYTLRGDPGDTQTAADQADALPIDDFTDAQGDELSAAATRAKHPTKAES